MGGNIMSYTGTQAVDFGRYDEDQVECMYHGRYGFQAVPLTELMAVFLFENTSTIRMYMLFLLSRMQSFCTMSNPRISKKMRSEAKRPRMAWRTIWKSVCVNTLNRLVIKRPIYPFLLFSIMFIQCSYDILVSTSYLTIRSVMRVSSMGLR